MYMIDNYAHILSDLFPQGDVRVSGATVSVVLTARDHETPRRFFDYYNAEKETSFGGKDALEWILRACDSFSLRSSIIGESVTLVFGFRFPEKLDKGSNLIRVIRASEETPVFDFEAIRRELAKRSLANGEVLESYQPSPDFDPDDVSTYPAEAERMREWAETHEPKPEGFLQLHNVAKWKKLRASYAEAFRGAGETSEEAPGGKRDFAYVMVEFDSPAQLVFDGARKRKLLECIKIADNVGFEVAYGRVPGFQITFELDELYK